MINLSLSMRGKDVRLARMLPGPLGVERWFTLLLAILVGASFCVYIEPSPFDVGMALLLAGHMCLFGLPLQRARRGHYALLLTFAATTLLPLLWTADLFEGMRFAVITCYLMLMSAAVSCWGRLLGPRCRTALIAGYVVAALISCALGLAAFFGLIPDLGQIVNAGRIRGLFKDPNVFGPFAVPAIIILLAFLRRAPRSAAFQTVATAKTLNLAAACAIFLLVCGVAFSFSRGAWLNLAVAVAAFGWLCGDRRTWSTVALFVLALLIVGAAACLLLPGEYLALLPDRLAMQQYDQDRFAVQAMALTQGLSHPLGTGPGQAEVLYDYATHSLYLRLLLENGIVGLMAFALLLAGIFRSLWQARYQRSTRLGAGVVAACLAGILANATVVDVLHWRHLWLLIGASAWWIGDSRFQISNFKFQIRNRTQGA